MPSATAGGGGGVVVVVEAAAAKTNKLDPVVDDDRDRPKDVKAKEEDATAKAVDVADKMGTARVMFLLFDVVGARDLMKKEH